MQKSSSRFLALVLLMGLPVLVSGQEKMRKHRKFLLDEKKPSVFLEFIRFGIAPPLFGRDDEKRVYLRLSNNSVTTISFCSFQVDKRYGDVGVIYQVNPLANTAGEDSDELAQRTITRGTPTIPLPHVYSKGDTCTPYDLQSGRSVVVSVAESSVSDKKYIEIEFWFDWENRDNVLGTYPKSIVMFKKSNMP